MKSWFIASGKDATSVELRDIPVPEPKAGELLVKVRAAGLNRGEFIAGHGLTGAGAWRRWATWTASSRRSWTSSRCTPSA